MTAEERASETTLHGVLVDVYGIGVLLLGESGTGKSECALDLVTRGHRLVADDVVEVARESDQSVMGRGPTRIRHHMEIRGWASSISVTCSGWRPSATASGSNWWCSWRPGARG
jgi:serine kinase of HPr protein (carbohydrate metabolism regulator)